MFKPPRCGIGFGGRNVMMARMIRRWKCSTALRHNDNERYPGVQERSGKTNPFSGAEALLRRRHRQPVMSENDRHSGKKSRMARLC